MELDTSSGPTLIGLRPQSEPVNTEPPKSSTLKGNRGIRNPSDGPRTDETVANISRRIEGCTKRNSGN